MVFTSSSAVALCCTPCDESSAAGHPPALPAVSGELQPAEGSLGVLVGSGVPAALSGGGEEDWHCQGPG